MFNKIMSSIFATILCLSVGLTNAVAIEYNACFDDVGMLKQTTQQEIREIGNKLYSSGKVEFTVKVVKDCPDTATSGREFFNQTGIGNKDKNNGLLLFINAKNFVANKSGKVRLIPGYGLEGFLPDSKCGRILDLGLSESGIDAKVLRMVKEIDHEFQSLGDNPVPQKEDGNPVFIIIIFIVLLIVIIIIFSAKGTIFDCGGFSGGGGGGFSGGGFSGGGGFGGGSCGGGGAGR